MADTVVGSPLLAPEAAAAAAEAEASARLNSRLRRAASAEVSGA